MFKDRKDAGQQLAEALYQFKDDDPLILAIPRGGVEIGFYVARNLGCELSVIITHKLSHPKQHELAFGALAEDKSLYFNPLFHQKLTKNDIDSAIKTEEKEIKRRIDQYRNGEPLPPIENRTVILIDDGIATGATLFAAIELCKKRKAKRIIVAAPVSGIRIYNLIQTRVNETIVLETPVDYHAVSQSYETFPHLSDNEVISFLKRSRNYLKTS